MKRVAAGAREHLQTQGTETPLGQRSLPPVLCPLEFQFPGLCGLQLCDWVEIV